MVGAGGWEGVRGDGRGGALLGLTLVRQVVSARSDNARVRSMLAVFDVLEMLSAARTMGTVRPSDLASAIKRHLDA